MSHEESFEEESSDGSTKLTHSIFSGPSEDYTCALNNGVKALVGDWSGLLGDSVGYGAEEAIEKTMCAARNYLSGLVTITIGINGLGWLVK